ncbi:MAG: spore germination protein [Clostridiaceae bacterium]
MDNAKNINVISPNVIDNLNKIQGEFTDAPDLKVKKVTLKDNITGYFIYIDGLIDIDVIQRDFITPVLNLNAEYLFTPEIIDEIPASNTLVHYNIPEVINVIAQGSTSLIIDGASFSLSCNAKKIEKRSVTEPETEKNVRGSHEGFIEALQVNTAILRRKIQNPKLKFKTLTIGTMTKQTLMVAYIDGIASDEILKILLKKLKSYDLDSALTAGHIEQYISESPYSPFPQCNSTERPDKAVASLLEGKFIILLDGTPAVLITPVSIFSFFQTTDDYSMHWYLGTFSRIVRLLGIIIALILPALYIAITSFHYYMIPLNLLIPFALSRSKVPFPPIIEALLMELTIEMLREASIRLPNYIASTIGVIGGIIIGQAAVEAGIVSGLFLVIVAVTAITSYVVPNYTLSSSFRLIRFIFTIATSLLGIVGLMICNTMIIIHILSLESFGQPYFQPIIPLKLKDLKDSIVRLKIKNLKRKPNTVKEEGTKNE